MCVCVVTKEAEDRGNWAENDFMKSEVQTILENCYLCKKFPKEKVYLTYNQNI